MLLACLVVFASCGEDKTIVSFDGGEVKYSEIEPLLDALAEVEGCEKGSEKYEQYYKEFSENLLFAKLYKAEHEDFTFTYSEEAYEEYLDALEKNTLEQYNMGLRKYANALNMTYAYYLAYVRLSLYKGAVADLEEKATETVKEDEAVYEQYLRKVYDDDPTLYTKVASCSGYLIFIDSRGDDEESKKSVYDEVAGYIARLEDGEDYFDIVTEVQTKYPNGLLSFFPKGKMFSVIYSEDYSRYTNSELYIYETLKTFDEGQYTHTPVEMISNDITSVDETTGETVFEAGEYFGYAIIMAKDVVKEDRQATYEEAREQIIKYLSSDYLNDMGAIYRENLLAKYHVSWT